MKSLRGFSLIELMVAVAIVGILATVAYPSYQEYVRRSTRTAAQAFLSDVAQRQEIRFQNVRTYTNSQTTLGVSTPASVSKYYNALTITVDETSTNYFMTMAPISGGVLSSDGTLVMCNNGVRFRDMNANADANCTRESADKGWEDR